MSFNEPVSLVSSTMVQASQVTRIAALALVGLLVTSCGQEPVDSIAGDDRDVDLPTSQETDNDSGNSRSNGGLVNSVEIVSSEDPTLDHSEDPLDSNPESLQTEESSIVDTVPTPTTTPTTTVVTTTVPVSIETASLDVACPTTSFPTVTFPTDNC